MLFLWCILHFYGLKELIFNLSKILWSNVSQCFGGMCLTVLQGHEHMVGDWRWSNPASPCVAGGRQNTAFTAWCQRKRQQQRKRDTKCYSLCVCLLFVGSPWVDRHAGPCGWMPTECHPNLPRLGRQSSPTAVPCLRHWSCCCSRASPILRLVVPLY